MRLSKAVKLMEIWLYRTSYIYILRLFILFCLYSKHSLFICDQTVKLILYTLVLKIKGRTNLPSDLVSKTRRLHRYGEVSSDIEPLEGRVAHRVSLPLPRFGGFLHDHPFLITLD